MVRLCQADAFMLECFACVIALEVINNDGNQQSIGQNKTGLLSILTELSQCNRRAVQLA